MFNSNKFGTYTIYGDFIPKKTNNIEHYNQEDEDQLLPSEDGEMPPFMLPSEDDVMPPFMMPSEDVGMPLDMEERIINPEFDEIFQGAITSKSSLSKVYNHSPPKSGGTFNSYDTKRSPFFFKKQKIETSYWSSGLSIDDFLLRTTLDFPSHVKIDVDGYESEIIKGCLKLLKSRKVKEYMIEMCSDSEKFIYKTMKSYGYVEIKKGMHKNGNWDSLFVKKNNKS